MPKYVVETISMFRMRYVVEGKSSEHAMDEVVMNLTGSDFKEFSQHHVDEVITSSREIDDEEYLKMFDEDNDYLKDWDLEQKMQYVNKINYEE